MTDDKIDQAAKMVKFLESAPTSERTRWMLATYKTNLWKLKRKKKELAE